MQPLDLLDRDFDSHNPVPNLEEEIRRLRKEIGELKGENLSLGATNERLVKQLRYWRDLAEQR